MHNVWVKSAEFIRQSREVAECPRARLSQEGEARRGNVPGILDSVSVVAREPVNIDALAGQLKAEIPHDRVDATRGTGES
jgi:hypothetical protein